MLSDRSPFSSYVARARGFTLPGHDRIADAIGVCMTCGARVCTDELTLDGDGPTLTAVWLLHTTSRPGR